MIDVQLDVYHRRARQLADAMRLCQDDLDLYAAAAALLAVHSAISYSDAVLIGLGNMRPRGENHREAVTALQRACTGAKTDPRGIAHFQRLVGSKSEISYGDSRIDDQRVSALCSAAERFQVWAERILMRRQGRRSL